MIAEMMPDLSHLSAEEREIIEQVFQRQRAEEQKEEEIAQKADKELDDIEKIINERKENAKRLVGTQNDAICQICQKTKFADGIGHKCFHCELRSCARCGGRTTHKNKTIWACSTCQKRQELFARSGKWFQSNQSANATEISPANSQTMENPGGMESYAEEQERQRLNGSLVNAQMSSSASQQLMNERRRQGSVHKQSSVELESKHLKQPKMNGSVHTSTSPVPTATHQPQITADLAHTTTQQQSASQKQTQKVTNPHQTNQRQQQVPITETAHTIPDTQINQQQRRASRDGHITQQRISDNQSQQQRTSQLKTERSYNANSVRTRTETMPEYTNGHSSTANQRSSSPIDHLATNDAHQRHRGAEKLLRQEVTRQAKHSTGQRMPAAVPSGTSSVNHHQRQSGSVLNGSGGRFRRGKLSRQIRSLSSSEDDESQSAYYRRHSAMEPDFSEKDLLKYIYGNQRFQKPNSQQLGFTNSLPSSRLGLYDVHSSTSSPALNNYILATNTLATKIHGFMQQPVSWQPSADQRRLIGHIVLQRPETDSGDLGLKVIGGRHSNTGRLGAFITQVKPGSVADYIGQLRPGDEVLEWNGEILQNLTHDGVYQIISASKNSPKVELIVSRSAHSPLLNEDYLNSQRSLPQQQSPIAHSDYGVPSISHAYVSDHYRIPHSKSLVNPQMAYMQMQDPMSNAVLQKRISPQHPGPNLGKLEFSLLYLSHEHELLITIYQAVELPPRSTGALRNPYVKVFLLPNRSEESRRQSKILYENLNPAWNECFFYYGVSTADLNNRALEITVWDYDQYNGHEFIGETVIDLSQILLDNQHFSYPLVDMDDENPLRLRLRQSRINSPYTQERYRSQSASCDDYRQGDLSHRFNQQMSMNALGYGYPPRDIYEIDSGHRSKYDEMEWNGYLSDHAQHQRPPNSYYHRRPRSATGFRHIADYEARSAAYRTQPITEESYDTIEDPRMTNQKVYNRYQTQQHPHSSRQNNVSPSHQLATSSGKKIADGMEFMSNRQRELIMQEQSGYGSDGSETLSANSAQSMQKRAANREEELQHQSNLQEVPTYSPRHHFYENPANNAPSAYPNQRYGRPNQRNHHEDLAYKINNDRINDRLNNGRGTDTDMAASTSGAMSLQVNNAGSSASTSGALSMKERKKSLMTRLIPGRNAPSDVKRTGFARSEEVGIPDSLSVNQNGDPEGAIPFLKQSSKDSTDSSQTDNFQPVLSEGNLGQFVDNLGPGQVVGRQALASPVLGEIQICLFVQNGALIVDIKRGKNLVIRPGTKVNPAPYVKVYLMQNKTCIAKAKTQAVRKTTAPIFNQKLSFAESYKHRMLQISVLGDYGRMERKSFIGIAQIRLDDLPLGGPNVIEGWYKLFHNTSLTGAAPVRKDSENSLMEM